MRRSAELIGYFVHPEIWCKMVLVVVKDTQSAGSLMVLAAIIRGAQRAQIKPYLLDISQTIANPDVCQSIQVIMEKCTYIFDITVIVSSSMCATDEGISAVQVHQIFSGGGILNLCRVL